ncbi:MAG: hypothetical protein EOP51_07070 [Sphingobacteriales bacterium]|nr:MAG: hypothetical protein EOP51_07070 [Sphingobacteriales bacterium]
MKKLCLLVVVVLSAVASKAQKEVLLQVPVTGNRALDFVPKGYDTLGTAVGDLNKDGKSDMVIAVFNVKKEEKPGEDEVPRILIVAFNTGSGYRTVFKGDNLLLCKQCGGMFGDPYAGVYIDKGVLSISHYGGSSWRWSIDQKFRFQNNDFYLIGRTDQTLQVNAACAENVDEGPGRYEDVNLVTGKRIYKEISDDCKVVADKTEKIKVKPLVKMADTKIID